MSRFFSKKYEALKPYVPGEQPSDGSYIKLNTNESPFLPSDAALGYAAEHVRTFNLYSDPDCTELKDILAQKLGLEKEDLVIGNGSDEILNFAFMAFCDDSCPAYFPDITYGFYKGFSRVNNIPYGEIPLKSDFSLETDDYKALKGTIFIANPNAPTGKALPPEKIEEVLKDHPDNIVVVDEAYVDFGAQSCIPLIKKYDNLLVVQTFSKSRSLAGARVGYAIGNAALIEDLERIKYSTNPYNVNRLSMTAACEAVKDKAYYGRMCHKVVSVREYVSLELKALGFDLTESMANFVFVKKEGYDGKQLYLDLKKEGILVRHFNDGRIGEYNRITIGTEDQMKRFIEVAGRLIGNQLSIYT